MAFLSIFQKIYLFISACCCSPQERALSRQEVSGTGSERRKSRRNGPKRRTSVSIRGEVSICALVKRFVEKFLFLFSGNTNPEIAGFVSEARTKDGKENSPACEGEPRKKTRATTPAYCLVPAN